jgi:hypothetical protein
MKHLLPLITTAFLLTAGTAAYGQATPPAADPAGTRARAEAKKATDADVTYGRVKEFTAGQKIVIDVDNAPDKEFEMTSKDVTVKVAKGLKVGDPVKVTEHEVMGKTKTVMIAKHSGGGMAHGDKDPAAKKP